MQVRLEPLRTVSAAIVCKRRTRTAGCRIATAGAVRRQIGTTDLHVSPLCLGTMQFGEAIDLREATELLDRAAEAGVNFFDTAEMYPVPQRKATQGLSEEYLGSWLKTQRREDHVIATKAAGPSGQMTYIRGGPTSLNAANISEAIDGSLARLQTDYIDLYMLHWPDRYVPMFGEGEYDPSRSYSAVPLEEQLEALAAGKAAGKIRELGLSNETAWGLMRFCEMARQMNGSCKVAALQNSYSLLCRNFDSSLAECCHMEGVSLLAYSPLAMGLLTGKYQDVSGGPAGARLNRYRGRYAEAESRYGPKPNMHEAVREYCDLAAQADLQPFEMSLRFVLGRPLVASAVTGVTSRSQLDQLVQAAEAGSLGEDLLEAIDSIHARYPNPAP